VNLVLILAVALYYSGRVVSLVVNLIVESCRGSCRVVRVLSCRESCRDAIVIARSFVYRAVGLPTGYLKNGTT